MAPHRLANEEHVNFGQAASATTYPRGRSLHGLGRGGEWATGSRTLSSLGLSVVLGFRAFCKKSAFFSVQHNSCCSPPGPSGLYLAGTTPCPTSSFFRGKWENNSRVC